MGRHEAYRAEMDPAVGEQLQDNRKATRRPRGLDPVQGSMLREMKHLRAVGEHRRTALAEVQPARVEFGERRHERSDRFSLQRREPRDFGNQVGIRELFGNRWIFRAYPSLSRTFLACGFASCCATKNGLIGALFLRQMCSHKRSSSFPRSTW